MHFNIDAPIQYYALLYFPESIGNEVLYARESKDVALYAQKVLIQLGNTNLFPSYLRFVQGVVDSEDIPLNVSRESVQKNAINAFFCTLSRETFSGISSESTTP